MNHNEEQSSCFRNSNLESRSDGGDNLSLVQFLYMEFFGAFLPGVTAVGSVLVILSHAAKNYGLIDVLFLKSMINWGLWPYGFALLLFLAYSVGVIVYRRPHEEPDAASCFRIVCRNHRRHTRCNDLGRGAPFVRHAAATAQVPEALFAKSVFVPGKRKIVQQTNRASGAPDRPCRPCNTDSACLR